jgi:hypothetical protein
MLSSGHENLDNADKIAEGSLISVLHLRSRALEVYRSNYFGLIAQEKAQNTMVFGENIFLFPPFPPL